MSDDLSYEYNANQPDKIRQLEAIDRWSRNERLRVDAYINQNREQWLNEARDQIALERQTASLDLNPNLPKRPIEVETRERVSLKIQGLVAGVEAEANRRKEEVMGVAHASHLNAPEVSQQQDKPRSPPVKRSAHALLDKAMEESAKVHAHYEHNRDAFIQDAHMQGVPDPLGAYQQAREDKLDGLRQSLHRELHQTFKKHGIERQAPSTPSYSGPKQGG